MLGGKSSQSALESPGHGMPRQREGTADDQEDRA
jgi:hypothetical protein